MPDTYPDARVPGRTGDALERQAAVGPIEGRRRGKGGGIGARIILWEAAWLHRGTLEDGGSRRSDKRDGKSDKFELHSRSF
jgi:hypothetical protein